MRNAKVSKVLAATMAATMLLTPATAFAAEGDGNTTPTTPASNDITDPTKANGELTGSGDLEGYVDKKVFRIVLPTTNVNFTLDPQGLLNAADKDKYGIASGAVYFENAPTADGGTATYSNKSDDIKFVNKSSYAIKVGLAVTLDTGDISLVKTADIGTATTPALSLGLLKDDDTTATDIDSASFKSTPASLQAVPEVSDSVTDGYKLTGSSTDPGDGTQPSKNGMYYSYKLTDDYEAGANQTVKYKLTGSCNNVAGWAKIDKAVTAKIAWTVADATAPGITGTDYSRGSATNTYTLENISQGISSIAVSVDGKTIAATVPTGAYSVDENTTTLTIDGTKNTPVGAGAVGAVRYFIVTFADGSKLTFSVNVEA